MYSDNGLKLHVGTRRTVKNISDYHFCENNIQIKTVANGKRLFNGDASLLGEINIWKLNWSRQNRENFMLDSLS